MRIYCNGYLIGVFENLTTDKIKEYEKAGFTIVYNRESEVMWYDN